MLKPELRSFLSWSFFIFLALFLPVFPFFMFAASSCCFIFMSLQEFMAGFTGPAGSIRDWLMEFICSCCGDCAAIARDQTKVSNRGREVRRDDFINSSPFRAGRNGLLPSPLLYSKSIRIRVLIL